MGLGELNGLDIFFIVCALVGGIPIIIRFIFQFIGADMGHDVSMGGDIAGGGDFHVGGDLHGDAGSHPDDFDPDASLRFLSLHGITSFLMMFGLVGFALYRQSQVGAGLSIGGGVVAGLISFWVVGKMFQLLGKMQSSGTITNDATIGCHGNVYLRIPANGIGRVTITVLERQREFDATAQDNSEIKTGIPVEVVAVKGSTLVVQPLS